MLRLVWYSSIYGTSLQASKIYKSLGKFVPNQQADSWIFLSIVMNWSFWCFEKIRCWIQFVGRNSGDFVMLLPAAPVQLPFRAPAPFGVERRSLLSRWGNLQLEQKQFFWIFGECNLLREFEWPSWFGDLSIYYAFDPIFRVSRLPGSVAFNSQVVKTFGVPAFQWHKTYMALKQKILFRTDLYSWQIGEGGVGNGQTQARLSLTEKGAQLRCIGWII